MITKDTIEEHIDLIRAFGEGKLQFHLGGEWVNYTADKLQFSDPIESYRRKPQPREWFVAEYGDELGCLYPHKGEAEERGKVNGALRIIKVREVLE